MLAKLWKEIPLFWYKNTYFHLTFGHSAQPCVESFNIWISYKSHHRTGHNLPLVIFKEFNSRPHNALHLAARQHCPFPLCSPSFLIPALFKTDGLPGRCLAGHCCAPETPVPRYSPPHRRSGREKTTTTDYEQMRLTAVCLSTKQLQIAICGGPISQRGIETQLHLQSDISI